MSETKKLSVPPWQQQQQQQPAGDASEDTTTTTSSSPPETPEATSRTALLEQAGKFLEDDSIREAPRERKVAFLESKGLSLQEIETLLAGAVQPEPGTSTSTSASMPKEEAAETQPPPNKETAKETAQLRAPRDVPPIITYPEFFFEPARPPPLVTLRSLLYSLYGAAGLGAVVYGASEYLVKPMLADLGTARHELAQTASENLTKLNEKLEQNVSRIPAQLLAAKTKHGDNKYDDEAGDGESVTSDPTELFHRDVATQTTPDLVHPLATALPISAPAPPTDDKPIDTQHDPVAAVTEHIKRLDVLASHLREIVDTETTTRSAEDSFATRATELRHYLDTLIYSAPTYTMTATGLSTATSTGYGAYSSPGVDGAPAMPGIAKGEEDAIAGFRAEIRGVKGALLSSRNFPSGRGARVYGGVAR